MKHTTITAIIACCATITSSPSPAEQSHSRQQVSDGGTMQYAPPPKKTLGWLSPFDNGKQVGL